MTVSGGNWAAETANDRWRLERLWRGAEDRACQLGGRGHGAGPGTRTPEQTDCIPRAPRHVSHSTDPALEISASNWLK